MAKMRFKKPKIAVLMSEIITLTIWLFLGDRVIDVLDVLVGEDTDMNISGAAFSSQGGCTNGTTFEDAFEIMGIGYDCADHTAGNAIETVANTEDGLLGVIGLVMVVMVLMNFVSYN